MKSVLISIKPEWCEKICHKIGKDENGKPIYEKCIEMRKTAPKEMPFKACIYMTKSRENDIYKRYKVDDIKSGKVIGEFICDKVYKIEPIFSFYDSYSGYDDSSDVSYFEDYSIDDERLKKTCLTRQELYIYGKDKPLYGWHISDLKIYDEPKELSEFWGRKNCLAADTVECWSCFATCIERNGRRYQPLTRPPQSWQYIDEVKE